MSTQLEFRRIDSRSETWFQHGVGDDRWSCGAVVLYPGDKRWKVSAWFTKSCEGIHFRTRTRREGIGIVLGMLSLNRAQFWPLKEAVVAYNVEDNR